jgi:flagellar assembly protein FliH
VSGSADSGFEARVRAHDDARTREHDDARLRARNDVHAAASRPRDAGAGAGAGATAAAAAGARFIPRRSLPAFTSWQPVAFDEPEDVPPSRDEIDAEVAIARQRGYDQGYGEGIAAQKALDDERAQQARQQVGTLLAAFDAELTSLEHAMAQTLARAATRLAREVLRAELATKPEHVAALARDAVDALLASARHIVVKVHPQDVALVEHGAGDVIHARGGRIVADPTIGRGGARIASDIGGVDATLAARWRDATAALSAPAWDDAPPDRPEPTDNP